MSEQNKKQSPTTDNALQGATGTQAYLLAAFCLVLGVALGYLFRGSASPASAQASAATTTQQGTDSGKQQSAEAQAALAQAAAPLLDAVNKNPSDYDSLVKLGNLF